MPPINLTIQQEHLKENQDKKHRILTFLETLDVFVDQRANATS